MNASTAKTLGIILVVFIILMVVWPLKYLLFAPAGVFHGLSNGWHDFRGDGAWAWPLIGFAGLFGLLFLAFWVVIIVWVYKDAEKRGMNAIVWALVVFFLHFLGLIIYMLIRSEHPVRSREPGPAGSPDRAAGRPDSRRGAADVPQVRQDDRQGTHLLPGLRRTDQAHLPGLRARCPARLEGLPELRRLAVISDLSLRSARKAGT